ncbi:CPBP family intramembrane metalloprotease [Bailinhaonella thermotolerans]|uniref:CPBP family intramembrane metalloprotease n=2 Tax=Bailinhaonella thermotolerans TaxID=1070861 RepID=A0A3A4AVW5_9ACTN|nr:CPBP family intramembrane metalloprotease [Bailinhaonella thermotolerans]
MFVSVLGSGLLTMALLGRSTAFQIVYPIATTVVALTLVALYRKYATREPWAEVGLRWNRRAFPQAVAGVLVGMGAVVASSAAAVALGAAEWTPFLGGEDLALLPLILAIPVLGQAFPEEVLFRGHLFGTLSRSLSPAAVLLVTSVVFGALHIISNSAAEGTGEKLLYVLQAVALGLACGASRARTGAVWMSAGVHAGLHFAVRLFPTREIHYDVQLLLLIAAMTLGAALVLHWPRRRAPAPAPSA